MIAAAARDAARGSIPPPEPIADGEIVKRQSRRHYGRPRVEVEEKIARALGYVVTQK
jgi:hypothetical protein